MSEPVLTEVIDNLEIQTDSLTVENNFNLPNSSTDTEETNEHEKSGEQNVLQQNEPEEVLHIDEQVNTEEIIEDLNRELDIDSNDSDKFTAIKKIKKKSTFIDSDDENSQDVRTFDEGVKIPNEIENKGGSDFESVSNDKFNDLDDNSEEEDNIFDKNVFNEKNKSKSRIKIIDSDNSDDENREVTDEQTVTKSRISALCDSDSSDEEKIEKSPKKLSPKNEKLHNGQIKSRFAALCDSESSEDEHQQNNSNSNDEVVDNHDETVTIKKSRGKKNDKPKKMTGKEAMEQRREISSESQRMMRESHVSLPYHRAKSHSLKEFMSQRKKVSDFIQKAIPVPNHLSIKMNMKQLEIAAKQLEEREKNLEAFYKSSSESEEEENSNVQNEKKDPEPSEEKIGSDPLQYEKMVCEPTEQDHVNSESSHTEQMESVPTLNEKQDSEPSQNEQIDSLSTQPEEINSELQLNEKKDSEEVQLSENTKEYLTDIENILGELSEQNSQHELSEENNQQKTLSEENNQQKTLSEENQHIDEHTIKLDQENEKIDTITNENESEIEKLEQNDIPKSGKMSILDRLRKMNPLLAMKTDFQPKICKSSDVIILDDDVEKSKAIDELKKRFLTHNKMKQVHTKDEKEIEGIDGNILKHESAKVLIDHDDVDRVIEQKPGVKLKKLREELTAQMAKKRLEVWEKNRKEIEEHTTLEEKEECGMPEEELEEAEMTETSDSSSDEEEIDDIKIKDKPRVKAAFADDEAEVSDYEADDDANDDEEDDDDNEEDDDENEEDDNVANDYDDEGDENDDGNNDDEEKNVDTNKKKVLKRIISMDNSDSENEFDDHENDNADLKNSLKNIINALSDESNDSAKEAPNLLDDTKSLASDEDIPLYQHENLEKTPSRAIQSKSDYNVPPISCLTALQSKSVTKAPLITESPIILPPEPSPLRKNPGLKTKLFENEETGSLTQAFEELENLCSGNFTSEKITQTQKSSQDDELLGLISGKFSNISELATQGNSDNFVASVDEKNLSENVTEEKNIDDNSFNFNWDDSQEMKLLLDENGSKENETKSAGIEQSGAENKKGKLVIMSSEEEENLPDFSEKTKKKNKKRKRKLDFSDDELSEDSDLEDTIQEEPREMNYDSEENEIEFDDNEEIVTKKVAKTFFEAEAELSESEWGSADEDERDLDVLEMEDGDNEQFNEKKLQKELGRIHMRQVLDQDNREVRLLQEMLLEDGELHGQSREKKFKWKNADSLTWNDDNQQKEGEDEDPDEIESELQWRKQRHEREVYLEEQRKKALENQDEVDLIASDSQIMQIGKEVLKKSQEYSAEKTISLNSTPESLTFSLLNQRSFRGSFLARSETSLSRLAELTTMKEVVIGNPKNNRNFLFTSVNKNDENDDNEDGNDKKRKASDGMPRVLKKMRISENSPGAVKSKKSLKKIF